MTSATRSGSRPSTSARSTTLLMKDRRAARHPAHRRPGSRRPCGSRKASAPGRANTGPTYGPVRGRARPLRGAEEGRLRGPCGRGRGQDQRRRPAPPRDLRGRCGRIADCDRRRACVAQRRCRGLDHLGRLRPQRRAVARHGVHSQGARRRRPPASRSRFSANVARRGATCRRRSIRTAAACEGERATEPRPARRQPFRVRLQRAGALAAYPLPQPERSARSGRRCRRP